PCKFPSVESLGRGHRSSEETEPCSEKRSLALPPPPQSVQRSLLPQLLHRPNTVAGTVAADTVEVWVVGMRWVVVTVLVEASTAGCTAAVVLLQRMLAASVAFVEGLLQVPRSSVDPRLSVDPHLSVDPRSSIDGSSPGARSSRAAVS